MCDERLVAWLADHASPKHGSASHAVLPLESKGSEEPTIYDTREGARLATNRERAKPWARWGPYLAERAWGTVREDYSVDGQAWELLGGSNHPSDRLEQARVAAALRGR